ncbi:hypothetical protein [Phaeovulum sp. NW3]|uniref:hypothetical protein n=1 Tax=Phaeovulum sp. NW3 TaxID=2934933 RepID=UPI00202259D4|nr:hypothetical protein [Phaeovulum sp. NW3]MCL7463690.1 hypothetical protein [Phaeovulum sp. NW3]
MKTSFAALWTIWNDEDGAVTVDWVLLTAVVVGFGAMVVGLLFEGTSSLSEAIATYLSAREV